MNFVKNKSRLLLTLSAVLLLSNISANCQISGVVVYTSKDGDSSLSTSVPNIHLRKAILIIEEYKFMKLELQAKDSALTKLSKQLDSRNRTIQQLRDKQTASERLVSALKKTNAISEEQLKLNEAINNSYRKEVRKANTVKWLAITGGIVGIFTTMYIMK